MAIEQRPLSEPTNRQAPLSAPPVDTTTATAINAASKVIDTVVPVIDKFQVDRLLTDLDTQVEKSLADTSFESIDLEAAETLTPEQTRALLQADRGTTNFVTEIDRLSASQRQGRGGKGQLDRADAVVKRFINEFPGRESEIREHAQNVLGLKQGVNNALEAAREDEEFQLRVERSIKQSQVQRAIDEGQGYVALFEDGSVDVETTANRGRVLQALDEQLGFRQTTRGRRSGGAGSTGGGTLSNTEIESIETQDLQGYASERMGQFVPGLTSQLKALINNPDLVDNQIAQTQEMKNALAIQREQEIQNIEIKFRGRFTDKAIDETVAQINDTFDRLNGLANLPAKQLADQITVLDNAAKLRSHTMMPTLMTLNEAGLGDAINSMDGPLRVIMSDNIQNTLANEIRSVVGDRRPARADDIINDVSRMAKDGKPIASMPEEEREKAIQLSAAYMNEMVKTRNTLQDTNKNAFLNLYTQTATSGTQVESTRGLNNAVKIFAQNGYAETMTQIASDPNMREKADIAGQIANNLALKAFHRTAPELQREVAEADGFILVYDPSTERLELELKDEFEFGQATPDTLTGVSTVRPIMFRGSPTGVPSPVTINTERLKSLNNALNVLTSMKSFSIYRNSYKGLTDRQIKEYLSSSQGIAIKGGRSSSLGGVSEDKLRELQDVNQLQQEQTGTLLPTDNLFTIDDDGNAVSVRDPRR